MDNRAIAAMLDEIADMLEVLGDNPFKVRAYRRLAAYVDHLDTELREIHARGGLGDIPGVGKALRAKLEEMLETGDLAYYRRLRERVPPGVLEMLAIPGLGPRKVGLIYSQTGISSLDELYRAAQEKRLRQIPGLGGKTEFNIKKGIDMLRSLGREVTLGTALPRALQLRDYLAEMPQVEAVEIVGSIRRGKPLVGDVDLLVASSDEAAVREKVRKYRRVLEVDREGPGYIHGRLELGLEFEVIVVAPGDFYRSLLLCTGSRAHREKMVEAMRGVDLRGVDSEQAIYQRLAMQYVPPELREDRGEIERAREGTLPSLVTVEDLRGDLHVHTDWSDGGSNLREMAEAARARGYRYLAVTDHSQSLAVSRGLDVERLRSQVEEIRALNREWTDFRLLTGIEVDILRDGSLDLPDEVLAGLDVVIASIHSHFRLSREEQTARLEAAIRNPHVDIIGHLTGRLLVRRPGYEVDVDRVLRLAREHRTALEINAHPDRLDIDEETARRACQAGVRVAICSDAHHRADLDLVSYGVLSARRGWVGRSDVLNAMELDELLAYLGTSGGDAG
ncbi:MAG: DNA polymerase/3'-5' exonuclease PolX [Syntrophomonadaceae bacterium]|jgi:DNA polymerase (family 10)|nr:DNA polymerase/3'-5' exonuclease PolX [Syntrophomonadaceae bacterium]MDH7496843.1 DNA polymerase/3'-5' exonuclease PolX [Syntrophomonadaceae bacterium]